MLLLLRNAFWTAVLPGVIAGYIPWRYFAFRIDGRALKITGITGIILAAFGVTILLGSIAEFALRGRGTLSPFDAPRRLVVSGLYRWVRNPMYVGVVSVLIGESLIVRSSALVSYALGFFVAANLFIMWYEEPFLRSHFGGGYAEYTRRVRRWIPRLTPWSPPSGASGCHDLTIV